MRSKKLLTIKALAFNLPDDFEGSYREAIKLLLEYHLSEKAKERYNAPDITEDKKLQDACDIVHISTVKSLFDNPNIRLCMTENIQEYKNNKWHEVR